MVKDLKDDSNNFLSLTELQTRYGLTFCPLKYCGILSTIKLLWKTHQNNFATNDPKNKYESFSTKLLKAQKASKLVYTKLLSRKSISPTGVVHTWCPGTGTKLCVVQTSVPSFECVFTFGAQYLVRTFKLSRISRCIEGTCIS